jgi:hypothetical protein
MIQRRQLSWLPKAVNCSLLGFSERRSIKNRAPPRQPGAPAQLRCGAATAGTQ